MNQKQQREIEPIIPIPGQINLFDAIYNRCASPSCRPCRADGIRDMCCHDCNERSCWHRCRDDRKICGLQDGIGYYTTESQNEKSKQGDNMKQGMYQQLMTVAKTKTDLTAEQQKFLSLHNEIMHCGSMAGVYAVQMAKHLKEMHDGALYSAAGFDSFGEYAETAVGIRERQAYNYVKIAEEYSDEFLHLNAKMGVTKLLMLAAVDTDQRAELIEAGAADDTVKELQAKITALEAEKRRLQSTAESVETVKNEYAETCEQLRALEVENERLTKEKDGIATKAAEVARAAKQAELDAERKRAEKLGADAKKLAEEKKKLEAEIKDLKERPVEVATVENPEAAAKLAAAQDELERVTKQLEIAADPNMTRFSVKFEDFQTTIDDMFRAIDEMTEDKREKCMAALRSVLEGFGL